MQRFKDSENQDWDITITIGDVRRVQAATGVNLLEPALDENGEPAGEGTGSLPLSLLLQHDLLKFYDVLQALLEPDAEAKGINAEQFGRRLAGKSLSDAHVAFFNEWRDFFHQLRREAMAEIVGKTAELVEKVYALAERQTSKLDVEKTMKEIEAAMNATAGASSGT